MSGPYELGPYEIQYQGRTYFGNVSLRECHIFDYDGNLYLIDVGSTEAYPISPRLAALIDRAASPSDGLVPESVMLELRKLKLIAGEEDAPPETPPAGEAGQSPNKADYSVANIGLFLAQECNMRCVYCYGDGGEYAMKGMMSEETAFRAVDWLIDNSRSAENVNICFFGGEPLLNFVLMKKVVPYAREKAEQKGKKIAFSITTNGSLLTDEIISFIKDEKIEPLISFDGPPEYQNGQRPFKDGSGSYDKVSANVRKLRMVLPHLKARATVYRDADPFRIKESIEQAGFTTCLLEKASPVILNGPLTGMPPDGLGERMLQRMLAFYRKEIDQLLAAIRERKINKDCPPELLHVMAGMVFGNRRYHGCGVGKKMAGISITGDIYPCHRFAGQEEMRMGNISDYHAGELNDYHRAIVDHLPECRSCWARYYCGGGCFYHNMANTGDMHRPDALDCQERKAMYEGLIQVYCRLDEGDKEYLKEILKDVSSERHP